MSKMSIPKKLRVEDFKSDYQEMIGKVSYVLTPFMDEVYSILNNNIDFYNLNRQVVVLNVKIDSTGALKEVPRLRTTVNGKVRGISVINAINAVNPNIYPTSHPFCSFTINGDILTILNIVGLQPDSEYQLTLELIV